MHALVLDYNHDQLTFGDQDTDLDISSVTGSSSVYCENGRCLRSQCRSWTYTWTGWDLCEKSEQWWLESFCSQAKWRLLMLMAVMATLHNIVEDPLGRVVKNASFQSRLDQSRRSTACYRRRRDFRGLWLTDQFGVNLQMRTIRLGNQKADGDCFDENRS